MDHVFTIYSLGDALFLQNIFNAIATITHGSAYQEGNFFQLCVIGGMIGFILTAFKGLLTGKAFELPSFVTSVIVWFFFFGWSATVNVHDVFSEEDRAVDNVPGGVALVGWVFSSIGYELANEFEIALQAPDQTTTLTEGGIYADSVRTLNALTTIGNNPSIFSAIDADNNANSDFKTSAVNYIRECTMTAIDLGYKTNDDLMTKSVSNVSAEKAKSSALGFPEGGNVYFTQLCDGNGPISEQGCRLVTCSEAYSALDSILNNAYSGQHTREALANILQVPSASSTTGSSKGDLAIQRIDDIFKMISRDGEAAQNFVKASIYYDLLPIGAANSALTAKDRTSALMLAQARLQRNAQWSGEGNMFQQIMRPVMTFIEVFAYAISPLIGFLVLLGLFGIKLATTYFMLIAWVQTWLPCLAIANNFINSTIQRSLLEFGGWSNTMGRSISSSGTQFIDSFYAVKRISDISQDTIATAGMFVGAIPLLSLFVLYGSIYTLNSLTGRMSAGEFINEKISAPDMVSPAAVMQGMSQMTTRAGTAWGTGEEGLLGRFDYRIGGTTSEQRAIAYSNGISNVVNTGLMKSFGEAFSLANAHGDTNAFQTMKSSMDSKALSDLVNVGHDIGQALGLDLNDSQSLAMAYSAHLGADFKFAGASHSIESKSASEISSKMSSSLSNRLNMAMGSSIQGGLTDAMQNAYQNSDSLQSQFAQSGIDQQQFSDSIASQKSKVDSYNKTSAMQASRGIQSSYGAYQLAQIMNNDVGKRALVEQEYRNQVEQNSALANQVQSLKNFYQSKHLTGSEAAIDATAKMVAMSQQNGTLGDDAQILAGQLIQGEATRANDANNSRNRILDADGNSVYTIESSAPSGNAPINVSRDGLATDADVEEWQNRQNGVKGGVNAGTGSLRKGVTDNIVANTSAELQDLKNQGENKVEEEFNLAQTRIRLEGDTMKAKAIQKSTKDNRVWEQGEALVKNGGESLFATMDTSLVHAEKNIVQNLSKKLGDSEPAHILQNNMSNYENNVLGFGHIKSNNPNSPDLTPEIYQNKAEEAGKTYAKSIIRSNDIFSNSDPKLNAAFNALVENKAAFMAAQGYKTHSESELDKYNATSAIGGIELDNKDFDNVTAEATNNIRKNMNDSQKAFEEEAGKYLSKEQISTFNSTLDMVMENGFKEPNSNFSFKQQTLSLGAEVILKNNKEKK